MYIYDGKISHMHRRMCQWNYTESINRSLGYKAKEGRYVGSIIMYHFFLKLSSAGIWEHKLCATLSANVNINYRLPIKVYYRICTLRHIRIEIIHGSQNVFSVLTWVNLCCQIPADDNSSTCTFTTGKSVTSTGACANEIIPNQSIARLVTKRKKDDMLEVSLCIISFWKVRHPEWCLVLSFQCVRSLRFENTVDSSVILGYTVVIDRLTFLQQSSHRTPITSRHHSGCRTFQKEMIHNDTSNPKTSNTLEW
jgi:hypothetical protein